MCSGALCAAGLVAGRGQRGNSSGLLGCSCSTVFSLPGHNHRGHPNTSYYQYGLGILALCVHQKRLHGSVVGKLLHAVEHDLHLPWGHLSVGEC